MTRKVLTKCQNESFNLQTGSQSCEIQLLDHDQKLVLQSTPLGEICAKKEEIGFSLRIYI